MSLYPRTLLIINYRIRSADNVYFKYYLPLTSKIIFDTKQIIARFVLQLFSVFNLGTRATCDTNYLEIHNVNQATGQSSFVSKYCGNVSINHLSFD